MDCRDHLIFMLSTDWLYLQQGFMPVLSSLSAEDAELVKLAARRHSENILRGLTSYFEADFSEDRISEDYRKFIDTVESDVSKKSSSSIKNFLGFLVEMSKKYSREVWLLSSSYDDLCKLVDPTNITHERFSEICRKTTSLRSDEIQLRPTESIWDRKIGSFFNDNDTEIYDFYSSFVVPTVFIKEIALFLQNWPEREKIILFEELETTVTRVSGLRLPKQKIIEIHKAML